MLHFEELCTRLWGCVVEAYRKSLKWACDRLGLLDCVHGYSGEVFDASTVEMPCWVHDLKPLIINSIRASEQYREAQVDVSYDYARGMIYATIWHEDGSTTTKEFKIGKMIASMIKKIEADRIFDWKSRLQDFQKRTINRTFIWKLTTDIWDIANMSHGRAWTSCMCPGHAYEMGVLSDMKG